MSIIDRNATKETNNNVLQLNHILLLVSTNKATQLYMETYTCKIYPAVSYPTKQPSNMPEMIMTSFCQLKLFSFFFCPPSDGLVARRLISTVQCPPLESSLTTSVRNLIGHSLGPLLDWTRKPMRAWRNITTHSLPCVKGSAECRSRLKLVRG